MGVLAVGLAEASPSQEAALLDSLGLSLGDVRGIVHSVAYRTHMPARR